MKNIVLIGNPNCGKTTLFNKLTASKEYVGNWSGVTVSEKIARLKIKDRDFNLVDLPGIYSLSGYSEDEIVSRDYLFKNKIDLIINVIDINNLERNLYLTSQLIDTGLNIFLVLNMADEFDKRGDKINLNGVMDFLKLNIIKISAAKDSGLDNLLNEIYGFDFDNNLKAKSFLFGTEEFFFANKIVDKIGCSLLVAFKIMEDDKNFLSGFDVKTENLFSELKIENKNWNEIIARDRYKFIDELCNKYVKKTGGINFSDRIDKILLNKYLALPVFFLIMFFVFELSFGLGGRIFSGYIEKFIR